MAAIAPKTFRWELAPTGVGTVTLDRPDVLNALTFDVYRELTDVFHALGREASVRAVVVTGAGRAFCSGGDVHEIIGELVKYDGPRLLEFTRMTGELVANIRKLRKPVVAAVNGTAAGAGAVIALACDLRVMSEAAKFAFLFVRVGLAGADMGAAFLLPRVIGFGRASEILMLGDPVPAARCLEIGLANRVVAPDKVLAEARALAERLAAGPTFAHGMTKELLNQELAMSLDQAIEAEAQGQQICMQTRDFKEAFEAFAGKREPRFEGR
jgi:enoyl-CoA hydratase/carnithine racemase